MKTGLLQNIFSKSKKENNEQPKITVDYRERGSHVIPEILALGIEMEFVELKVADYIVNGTAIERKTVFDFVNSMKNHRLVRQLEEIQQYEKRLLIIEGIYEQELYTDSLPGEGRGMHPNSIRGFLLSILLNYKVPIVFTKNAEDTAKFMNVLLHKKKTEVPLNVSKKTLNTFERMQFILEGFPGIGPKTARKLLKKFKTLKATLNASEEEIREVLGKKSESFIKIVNKKYHAKR